MIRVHGLMGRPKLRLFLSDVPAVLAVAMPAVLTNIATPVSNAYITAAIAPFGDSAVAGWAILGRIMPVAFGAIFALSGTVGPILGQNYGARAPDRVRETYTQALKVTLAFTAAAWLLLAVFAEPLARAFQATAEAAALIVLFCRWLARSSSSSALCSSPTPPSTRSAGRTSRRRSTGAAPRSARSLRARRRRPGGRSRRARRQHGWQRRFRPRRGVAVLPHAGRARRPLGPVA